MVRYIINYCRQLKTQTGFTLIEVLCVLMLLGVLAGGAGLGLATAGRSVILSRDANAMALNAQIAMARLGREITDLSNISSASEADLTFSTARGARALIFDADAGTLMIEEDPPHGGAKILLDQVVALEFAYRKNNQAGWASSDSITELSAVDITITLRGIQSGVERSFTSRIIPRANNNSGGNYSHPS